MSEPVSLEWEEAIFRETWLIYLTDPEDNAAARRLSALAYQLVLGWLHFPPHERPMIEVELGAVVRDLYYLESFLRLTVAEDPCSGADPDRERVLAAQARGWSARLAEVAMEIEEALGGKEGA